MFLRGGLSFGKKSEKCKVSTRKMSTTSEQVKSRKAQCSERENRESKDRFGVKCAEK